MANNANAVKVTEGKTNNTVHNELEKARVEDKVNVIHSLMNQKVISDKKSGKTSEFMVISTPDFKNNDWISKSKFSLIGEKLLEKNVLIYTAKKAIRGNKDEGKDPVEGKIIKFILSGDLIEIAVHKEEYGSTPVLTHSHKLLKTVFDAYVLVAQNDLAVSDLEKKTKDNSLFLEGA